MKLKRKLDTEESRAFWQSVDNDSWKLRHTWPDWKLEVGSSKLVSKRVKIQTFEQLKTLLNKERITIPSSNVFEFKCRGLTFLIVRNGDSVSIYRPGLLYLVDE